MERSRAQKFVLAKFPKIRLIFSEINLRYFKPLHIVYPENKFVDQSKAVLKETFSKYISWDYNEDDDDISVEKNQCLSAPQKLQQLW